MPSPDTTEQRVLLVAPNISRLMGGEGIKALRILEGYLEKGLTVHQITHARVRREMDGYRPDLPVSYIEDDWLQALLHRLRATWALGLVNSWMLRRAAQRMIDQWKPTVVHFTSPISTNLPYFRLKGAPVVIGPLNGNIIHPPAFLHRESKVKLGVARVLKPVQQITNFLFRGKRNAHLLVAGGERTFRALELGGCRRAHMTATLDSGVDAGLRKRARLVHQGINRNFVFVGRLVRYKGCDLAIRAIRDCPGAHLDIIGDGPEKPALERLVMELGLADRVNFVGWLPVGDSLFDRLGQYRALVFPTLAEANGIVVQEAMMLGLPVIAVNWGGPAELLHSSRGVLIEPDNEKQLVRDLTQATTLLAENPEEADRIAASARAAAETEGYDWPSLLGSWVKVYAEVSRTFRP